MRKRRSKRDLVQRVARHVNIRVDVVEDVLNGLIDVSMEEVVNKGEFGISDLFMVEARDWAGYKVGDSVVPSRPRLVVTLAKKVKALWKFRWDVLDGETGIINKDNWRDVPIYEKSKNISKNSTRKPSAASIRNIQNEDYNPFLDDDDS